MHKNILIKFLWDIGNCSHVFVITPLLIATHAMTSHQIHGSTWAWSVQTVVIRHNLLSFCIRKYLIATETVTIANADFLTRLVAHRIEASLRVDISYLKISSLLIKFASLSMYSSRSPLPRNSSRAAFDSLDKYSLNTTGSSCTWAFRAVPVAPTHRPPMFYVLLWEINTELVRS